MASIRTIAKACQKASRDETYILSLHRQYLVTPCETDESTEGTVIPLIPERSHLVPGSFPDQAFALRRLQFRRRDHPSLVAANDFRALHALVVDPKELFMSNTGFSELKIRFQNGIQDLSHEWCWCLSLGIILIVLGAIVMSYAYTFL